MDRTVCPKCGAERNPNRSVKVCRYCEVNYTQHFLSLRRQGLGQKNDSNDEGINIASRKKELSKGTISNVLSSLQYWYLNITKKQRNIILISATVLSLIPFVGWIFIAPWLLPLIIYLEYHRP